MSIERKLPLLLWRRNHREDAHGVAPISCRVTLNGVRCELATGVSCPAAYWPKDTNVLVLPSAKQQRVLPTFSEDAVAEYNDELRAFKREVTEVYQRLRRPHLHGPLEPVTAAQLRRAVRGEAIVSKSEQEEKARKRPLLEIARAFLSTAQDVPQADRLADSTLQSYESRCNMLKRYLTVEKALAFAGWDLDIPWARRYERWLVSATGGNLGALAMRKQVNLVQVVQNFAVAEGWLPAPTLHGYKYQTRTPPPSVVSLPAAEVARLTAALPELDDACRRAVTGWLFCCHTGLSWADYGHFCQRPADYLFTEPGATPASPPTYWLRMVRQKMKRRKPQGFSVPLFGPAADLLMKWRGRLPYAHLSGINELLHLVEAELALSQSLTTKLARATFSQLRRDEGYSDEAVAAMMGDSVSVMNKHYSKVSEQRILLEMNKLGGNQAAAEPTPSIATAVPEETRWRRPPATTSYQSSAESSRVAPTWAVPTASRREAARG